MTECPTGTSCILCNDAIHKYVLKFAVKCKNDKCGVALHGDCFRAIAEVTFVADKLNWFCVNCPQNKDQGQETNVLCPKTPKIVLRKDIKKENEGKQPTEATDESDIKPQESTEKKCEAPKKDITTETSEATTSNGRNVKKVDAASTESDPQVEASHETKANTKKFDKFMRATIVNVKLVDIPGFGDKTASALYNKTKWNSALEVMAYIILNGKEKFLDTMFDYGIQRSVALEAHKALEAYMNLHLS